jgi:hypothetical protein
MGAKVKEQQRLKKGPLGEVAIPCLVILKAPDHSIPRPRAKQ